MKTVLNYCGFSNYQTKFKNNNQLTTQSDRSGAVSDRYSSLIITGSRTEVQNACAIIGRNFHRSGLKPGTDVSLGERGLDRGRPGEIGGGAPPSVPRDRIGIVEGIPRRSSDAG